MHNHARNSGMTGVAWSGSGRTLYHARGGFVLNFPFLSFSLYLTLVSKRYETPGVSGGVSPCMIMRVIVAWLGWLGAGAEELFIMLAVGSSFIPESSASCAEGFRFGEGGSSSSSKLLLLLLLLLGLSGFRGLSGLSLGRIKLFI